MTRKERVTTAGSVGLVLLLGGSLFIAGLVGYGVGIDEGVVRCQGGDVLTLDVSDVDDKGNGKYSLSIGDCERINDGAFVEAVKALVSKSATTTTTTTTSTTTTSVAPAAGAEASG